MAKPNVSRLRVVPADGVAFVSVEGDQSEPTAVPEPLAQACAAKFSGVDVVYFANLTRSQGFNRDHRVIVYRGSEEQLQQLGLVQESELPLGRRRSRGSGYVPNLWFVSREKGKHLHVWREINSDVVAGELVDEVEAQQGERAYA